MPNKEKMSKEKKKWNPQTVWMILLVSSFLILFSFQAKEFGIKMKNILPAKDGKFVSQFDSWRIPRNNGGKSDES